MSDPATKPKTAKPKAPVDHELRAMRRINAILAELDPDTANRVARYCGEKAMQRAIVERGLPKLQTSHPEALFPHAGALFPHAGP